MDPLKPYGDILEQVVREWGGAGPSSPSRMLHTICDRDGNQFLLVSAGWRGAERVHSIVYHAYLRDGKVWVEWDGTDPSINEELLRRGIPREDMVLGFVHPTLRSLAAAAPEAV